MAYSPEFYRHELDQKAFDALNAFPMFVNLQEAYLANVDEVAARIDNLSTKIRVNEHQFPEVYELLPPICEKLGIEEPELYYEQSKELNAYTFGTTRPFICLTSRLVNEFSSDMIASVLAHECGHIACKHTLCHSMAVQLAKGIAKSPLYKIPAVKKYLTKPIVNALLFWDRCSELSADRAAVLCDVDAGVSVDMLLRIHGYKNINREEFLNQAMDLKKFVQESPSNKLMEWTLTQNESHPRLATRAYECYEWSKSDQFKQIQAGTYRIPQPVFEEQEVIAADVSVACGDQNGMSDLDRVNEALDKVNAELDRYTCHADNLDYALAVSSGILAGIIDSVFVGEFSLDKASKWGQDKVEKFVMKTAKSQGYSGDLQSGAIRFLENKYPVAADLATDDFGYGWQHHLQDFTHHASPIGLICSILTQFTGEVYGVTGDGVFQAVKINTNDPQLIGKTFKDKIICGTINWVFHLVSDMAGSSGTVAKGGLGTGIPGPFASLLNELSALPFFRQISAGGQKELFSFVQKLFNGNLLVTTDKEKKVVSSVSLDLRTEVGIAHELGKQAIPVLINECMVRAIYSIRQLATELSQAPDLYSVNWNNLLPAHNRTIDRMLTVSSMTFSIADTADAAIHAAIDSGTNWILSATFVTRLNYVGLGRSAVAVVREINNEQKEAQLLHEKMLLSEQKTDIFLAQLQEFKEQLEEKVTTYLVEDLEAFMAGFEDIEQGLACNDSNQVIKGNLVIQKVLGREAQFTNQEEFDLLMNSDEAFQL